MSNPTNLKKGQIVIYTNHASGKTELVRFIEMGNEGEPAYIDGHLWGWFQRLKPNPQSPDAIASRFAGDLSDFNLSRVHPDIPRYINAEREKLDKASANLSVLAKAFIESGGKF